MKARYKIGTDIKYVRNQQDERGEITAIVTRKEGHSYLVDENETEVKETDILKAYREIKARMPKEKKEKKARKPKADKDQNQQQAA